jgi:hypothetical protein
MRKIRKTANSRCLRGAHLCRTSTVCEVSVMERTGIEPVTSGCKAAKARTTTGDDRRRPAPEAAWLLAFRPPEASSQAVRVMGRLRGFWRGDGVALQGRRALGRNMDFTPHTCLSQAGANQRWFATALAAP